MPRVRKKVTSRRVHLHILEEASETIRDEGRTVKAVAKDFAICHSPLLRFHKKNRERNLQVRDRISYRVQGTGPSEKYAQGTKRGVSRAAALYHELSSKEIR